MSSIIVFLCVRGCVCQRARERFNDLSVIACWNDTNRDGSGLGQSSLVAFIKINKSAMRLKESVFVGVCVCCRLLCVPSLVHGPDILNKRWHQQRRYLFGVDALFITVARCRTCRPISRRKLHFLQPSRTLIITSRKFRLKGSFERKRD